MTTDIKSNIDSASDALVGPLAKYMSTPQSGTLMFNLQGEEGEFFAEKILRILSLIEAAPVTYEQDDMGDQAVVHFHYFGGSIDAWITELDMDGGVDQAFGLQSLSGDVREAEFGYISITELLQNNIELDLYFVKKTVAELRAGR